MYLFFQSDTMKEKIIELSLDFKDKTDDKWLHTSPTMSTVLT